MFTIMDNRKRARLELNSPPSQTAGIIQAGSSTTIEIGGQSYILSNAGTGPSTLPANILLSICDENSDESEEYIIDSSVLSQIKQENTMASTSSNQQQQQSATTQLVTTVPQYRIINQSGKTLLNHNNATTFTTTPTALVTSQISQPKSTLIPTSMQLSSGCEIYVIKEIGEPPKQLLSESAQPTIKTLGNNNTTIKLEPPISPTPAPAAGTLQILRSTSNTTSAATSSKQQQSIASNLCQNSIVMNNTNISSSPQQEESVKRSLILEAYKKRDDKRRATHNEVERRRRDKINSWIFKLKEMLPSDMNNVLNAGGNSGTQNKDIISNTNNNAATAPTSRLLIQQQGCSTQRTPPSDSKSQILIKACEYIKSMQEEIQSLRECLTENENLRLSNQRLQDELNNLRNKQQLQQHQTLNNNNHNSNNNTSNALLLSTHSDDDECELTLNSLNTTYANVQLFSPNSTNLSSIIGQTTTTNASSVTSNSGIIYAKRELIIRDYVD